jgi:Insect pheromone-binding family, A10/OS-D
VLLTECAKCSVQMQRNIEHMVHVLQKEYPLEWNMLVKHYDPTGSYQKRYTQYLLQVHGETDQEQQASSVAATVSSTSPKGAKKA